MRILASMSNFWMAGCERGRQGTTSQADVFELSHASLLLGGILESDGESYYIIHAKLVQQAAMNCLLECAWMCCSEQLCGAVAGSDASLRARYVYRRAISGPARNQVKRLSGWLGET